MTRKQKSGEENSVPIPARTIQQIVIRAAREAGLRASGLPLTKLVPIEMISFRRAMFTESERGCALIAAAHLDTKLEELLRSSFLQDATIQDDMFRGTGPLATFSARISLAYLLGLISKKGKDDLHHIRKIRNEFAHNPSYVSFDVDPIRSHCSALYHDAFNSQLTGRDKFVRVVMGIEGTVQAAIFNSKQPSAKPSIDRADKTFQRMATSVFENIMKLSTTSSKVRGGS